jgi:hypothetical protein
MAYHLNIDWTTAAHDDAPPLLDHLSVELCAADTGSIFHPVIQGRRLQFKNVSSGFYLLSVHYDWQGTLFDSFAFGLDIPDVTLMKLQLSSSGKSRIEQMGELNDYGEFIDTLLSDEPLYLTRPQKQYPVHAELVPLLQSPPQSEAQIQQIQRAFGDLAVSFPQVQQLWAYQLRHLLTPGFLSRCTAEALACFQHLLVNHLALMDDESLLEHILLAIEAQGVTEQVARLTNLLSWNAGLQTWDGMDLFLQKISGSHVLKY